MHHVNRLQAEMPLWICGTKNPSFDKQPNKIETELQTMQNHASLYPR